MKNIKLYIYTTFAALLLIQTSCNNNEDEVQKRANPIKLSQGYINYVSEFTSGVINKNSDIKFILNKPVLYPYNVGEKLPSELISISPNVNGDLVLEDKFTVVFKPKELLKSSTVYSGKLNLKKLVKADKNFAEFPFQVQTLKQNANLEYLQYKPYTNSNLSKNYLEAVLKSVDYIDDSSLSEIISVDQDGKDLPVTFIRKSDTEVTVIVDSIMRRNQQSFVILDFNGENIGTNNSDTYKINIPSIDDFKVMEVRSGFYPKRYIDIVFSSPISESQDLKGLVGLFDSNNKIVRYNYVLDGTVLRIHPKVNKEVYSARVYRGIEDINDLKLKSDYNKRVKFKQIIPTIKLVGKGTIMPDSEDLIFPFEAKGLKEVRVTIVRVFKNNMGQFLQENTLSSSSNLKKVGRPIYNSDVPLNLDDDSEYSTEKRYYIDINNLIDVEKGAIYNVELSFRKRNIAFPCESSDQENISSVEGDEDWDGENSTYEYGYYYDDYGYDYDYNERYNPCHSYFYKYSGNNTKISKNLISSNYGIIAKQNEDGTYNVIVTDLRTALPVPRAVVELYNYQNQIILKSETNEDGFVTFNTRKRGFYIKISKEENVGYLRLKQENALSYSMFDISGKNSPKGVKGYIYGERGVWRPGDSLHLFFILEDKLRKLPNEYPVTFELFNPENQLIKREVVKEGLNGFYKFTALTSSDAVTGRWSVKAKVGGQTFSKSLRIEMVKPNRLKVELTATTKILRTGRNNPMSLSSKWLTGANAGALKATVKVKLMPIKTTFKGYSQYIFDDPTKTFYSKEDQVLDSKLDAKGKNNFNYGPESNNEVPGMLRARFTSYVYEKGGDYSLNTQDFLLSNYNSYVGLNFKLDEENYNLIFTDKDHTLNLVTVDEKGKKVNSNLSVKIYKLRWSWWWSSSDQNIANYIKNTDYLVKESGNIKSVNGKASFKFSIKHGDWGRYYIQVTDKRSGHVTGKEVYIDWPNWNSRGNSNPDAATMLTFSSEKTKYKVGEDVKLIIPTAAEGRALISIEKGGQVLKLFWAETKKGVTEVTFKATSEMSPNIYANITYIQKHSQTANDLPIRMYGTTPITIEDPDTHLWPQVSTPKSIESESNYNITVSEKDGKEMTYSLAIVDEGLLDLTNYKTPTLWDFFYQREALRTTTWDMYDFVMGSFGTRLEKMFAIGGDSELEKKSEKKANRFVPVVKVIGPMTLKKGENKVHNLKMSNYIGSVRVMVVAGNNGAYGKAEKTVLVKKPVMVLATLPRVLGTDETCVLPVTVFAMDENVKNVKVKVKTNEEIAIVGSSSSSLKFDKTGEKMVYFKLKTSSKTGVAKVIIEVESNGSRAYQEIELDVRNPNPPISVSEQYMIEDDDLSFNIEPLGIEGTNEISIEVSAMPSINIDERLKYLIQYPHGCIEQTTSSVFPQLYLNKITNVDRSKADELEKNIKAGIARLYKFQLEDGGMSYWIGDRYSNEWGTSYAGHFMLEAEELGYALPFSYKEKWIKYQISKANSWTANTPNEMVQAYRLYTLALAGKASVGAMNRLKELPLRVEAREMLASAYSIIGQMDVARQLVLNDNVDYVQPKRSYYYYSYGSRKRDDAVRLMTYAHLKDQNHAQLSLEKVAESLSSDRYMSTQTAAFSLLAVSKYIMQFNPSNNIDIEYEINGKSDEIESVVPIYSINIKDPDKNQKVKIEKNNDGILYVKVIKRGVPLVKEEIEFSENLSLTVRYTDVIGNTINVDNLKQGTEFKAVVVIRNANNVDGVKDVALTQIFPSGWEIVNNRLLGTVDKSADQPDFIDIRDDRVYQYFDLKHSETKSYIVSLIAAYSGEYYLPGVVVEAMYDDNFKAMIKGKKVKVIK